MNNLISEQINESQVGSNAPQQSFRPVFVPHFACTISGLCQRESIDSTVIMIMCRQIDTIELFDEYMR